ncbi:MAG: PKD domain-containing protein [Bacteroidota bacterium]
MKKIYFLSAVLLLALFSACIKEEIVDQVAPEPEDAMQLEAPSNTLIDSKTTSTAVKAAFDVELTNGTIDEKMVLNLSNQSKNAVSYEWDFGNGDTSTDELPSYKYNMHGYYTVTLKATGADGKVSEMSKEVLVLCIYGGGDHSF